MLGSSLLFSGRLLYAMPIAVIVLAILRLLLVWRSGGVTAGALSKAFYIGMFAAIIVSLIWAAIRPPPKFANNDVELINMSQMMAKFGTANVTVESRRVAGAVVPLTLGLGSEPPLLPFVLHLPQLLSGRPVPVDFLLFFVNAFGEVFAAVLLFAAYQDCRGARRKRSPTGFTLACFTLAFLCLTKIVLVVPALGLLAWMLRGKRDWVYDAVRREAVWLGLLFVCMLPMLDVYRRAALVPPPPALTSEAFVQSRTFLEKYPARGTIVVSAHPSAFAILGYASISYATFLQEWEAMMGSLGSDLNVLLLQEQEAGKPLPGQELEGIPVSIVGEVKAGSQVSIRALELGI